MDKSKKTTKYYETPNVNKSENEHNKTAGQTKWAVRCFQNWCFEHLGQTIDFNAVSKSELNEILSKFYLTVKNGRGDPYGFSGFMGLRAGLNRHLGEPPLSWCLMKDTDFMSSNDLFLGLAKKLQCEPDQSRNNKDKVDGDFMEVIRWTVLDPGTPEEPTDVDSNSASLASLEADCMDSDSNGGNSAVAQVTLRHVVESWRRPEPGATFKTENDEGSSSHSPDESTTPAASNWPASDDDHVPYLTETQMMARVRQQRFTQEELDILVREIQARYQRIYTKGLPFAMIRRAWEEVAAAVTSAGVGPIRTASACQTRFRDLKRRSRTKLVDGGSAKPPQRPERGAGGEDAQHASTTGDAQHASTTGDAQHASTTGDFQSASTTGDFQSASTTATPAASSAPSPDAEAVDDGNGDASFARSTPSSSADAPSGAAENPSSPATVPSQPSRNPLDVRFRTLELLRRGSKPRSRKHFTGEQMDILLREIRARHHRLYGESQNPLRSEDRRQAWEEVAAAINGACCGPTRTAAACCKRFSDLKRRRKTRLGSGTHTASPAPRHDGPIITAAFSHASPMGMHILPSVTMETPQRHGNTATATPAAAKPKPATPTLSSTPTLVTALSTPVPRLAPTPTLTPATTPAPSHTSTRAQAAAPAPSHTSTRAQATTPAPSHTSTRAQATTPAPSHTSTREPAPAEPANAPHPPAPPGSSERPVSGAEGGVPGASPSPGPPEGGSSSAAGGACVCACVCARRRRWEAELLEVQRGGVAVLQGELGALNTRLRRMERRTHPLLLSVSRSLERIATAMERNANGNTSPNTMERNGIPNPNTMEQNGIPNPNTMERNADGNANGTTNATAMEQNAIPNPNTLERNANASPDVDTPPRTPRGRSVVERPAVSQSRGRKRGRHS